jgi:hypothetical protein
MNQIQRTRAKDIIKGIVKSHTDRDGYPLNVGPTTNVSTGFRVNLSDLPRKVTRQLTCALRDAGFMINTARTPVIQTTCGPIGGHFVMYVRA